MNPEPELGTLGEEAAKLLDAVHGWARRTFSAEHIATGAQECTGCPVCQVVSVLRGDHPDVTERLSGLAAAGAEFLRTVTAKPGPADAPEHG